MFKWTCLNWLWDCWSAECFTLTYYLNDFLSLELMAPFCFEFFVISFLIYLNISFVLSCNSMPLNGCSVLYRVNTNEKKRKKEKSYIETNLLHSLLPNFVNTNPATRTNTYVSLLYETKFREYIFYFKWKSFIQSMFILINYVLKWNVSPICG